MPHYHFVCHKYHVAWPWIEPRPQLRKAGDKPAAPSRLPKLHTVQILVFPVLPDIRKGIVLFEGF